MPVLPLLLSLLPLAAEPVSGYRPTGSLAELADLGLLARLRDPALRVLSFGSHEHRQANDLLVDTPGPGILQSLWFAQPPRGDSSDRDAILRIHLDGQAAPALQISLHDFFRGKHPHFPQPLVTEGAGGCFGFVPIPFRAGCRVAVEHRGARAYHIRVLSLPDAEGIRTFTEPLTAAERATLARAVKLWSHPERSDLAGAEVAEYAVEALGHSTLLFELPPGPRTIRSFEIRPAPTTAGAWRGVRLRLGWDTDDPARWAVDVPLGLAFGHAEGSSAYQSVLVGQSDRGWSNRFPMPYHRRGRLRLDSEQPLAGTLRVVSLPGTDADAGYFHAQVMPRPRTSSREDFPPLSARGRGHYAGLFWTGAARPRPTRSGFQGALLRIQLDGQPIAENLEEFLGVWSDAAPLTPLSRITLYPLHGLCVYDVASDCQRGVIYRWHLTDPFPFTRAIQAGLEPGPDNPSPADTRAALFWYSDRTDG
jgi:hypothetical protein